MFYRGDVLVTKLCSEMPLCPGVARLWPKCARTQLEKGFVSRGLDIIPIEPPRYSFGRISVGA